MKASKFLAVLALVLGASGAFADAANVLVSFSTKADCYADGKPVQDGEWYALCWSSDGKFEGLNLDCTPIDPNDLLIMMAPLAKDGGCPYTVFQIDSQSPNCKRSGTYSVVMLDTRDVRGVPSEGEPTAVNAAAVAQDYKAGGITSGVAATSSSGMDMTTPGGASTGGLPWAASRIDTSAGDFKPAAIKGFKVSDNAKIEFEIGDMLPGVKYNLKMGETLDKMESYALEVPADANTQGAKIIIDAKNAKFFQLVREPLTK